MIDDSKDLAAAAVPDGEAATEPAVEAEAPAEEGLDWQTGAAPTLATIGHMVLKRAGAETDITFPVNPPAVIGRFDPSIGPIEVDLGSVGPESAYISRKHAKITLEEGVWKLTDLGSSNGTFLLRGDFERVEEAELKDGDEFALGNARFVFRLEV